MNSVLALLDFAERTTFQSLDAAVNDAANLFLADAIAVGIAGSREPLAKAVRDSASRWGEGEDATVLGTTARLPVASAAFVNSFQVHCQEFDPLHEGATVHAMAVITGPLLATAEARALSGEDLVLGTVIGVEVAVSLGLAASEGLRFFRPGTAGTLGTTIALARIAGLDRATTLNAVGLAYSQLAGTMQAHVEGSVALPVQIAHAARAAVTAIDLAEAGLDGPHDVLDGPFGYFALYERGGNLEPLIDRLGTAWRVTELSHKPFPTGRAAHAMLDAAATLQARHGFGLSDVDSITATVPPLVKRLVDRPAKPGMSVNYARLCLPFLLAGLLEDSVIDAGTFVAERLVDRGRFVLNERLEFVVDESHGVDVLSPQQIEIRLNDGRSLTMNVPDTLGSPGNPLDAAARRSKFDRCLAGTGIDGERLWDALEQVARVDSAQALLAKTVGA